MSLKEKIRNDLNASMKNREELKTSTLKMLMSAIANKEIELKKKDTGLANEEIERIVKSEAKKRNDAAEAYEKGGRPELAEKEKNELSILGAYLPEEMPDEKVEKIIKECIEFIKAKSMEDFGKVMKETTSRLRGQVDGKKIAEIVKKLLS